MIDRVFNGNAIGVQKDPCAFSIFDTSLKGSYENIGIDSPGYLFTEKTRLDNIESIIQQTIDKGYKYLCVADTL